MCLTRLKVLGEENILIVIDASCSISSEFPNISFNSNHVDPPSPSIFHRMTVEPIPIMSDTKAQSVHHRLQVDRRSGA